MYDRRKSRRRQTLVSVCCLLAIGYFAYHAVSGNRGWEARSQLAQRAGALRRELARLEAVRARLERDVKLLDAGDADIVEEVAIGTLGFARPGDRIVAFPPEAGWPRSR